MKAVVLYGKEDVRLAGFSVPEMTPTSIKVAVEWCGICGSDLHKFEGKKNTHPIHYPIPLGHEISGYVAEVGSDVKGVKVGDAVTADPNWSCGHCYYCQKGQPSFCESARGVVMGMGQYWVSPQENVYHLPEGLDLRTAALTEPLACCLHGMDLLARPEDLAIILSVKNSGPGLVEGARLARQAGAKVVVCCCQQGTALDGVSDIQVYGTVQSITTNRLFGCISRISLFIITRTIVEYLLTSEEGERRKLTPRWER